MELINQVDIFKKRLTAGLAPEVMNVRVVDNGNSIEIADGGTKILIKGLLIVVGEQNKAVALLQLMNRNVAPTDGFGRRICLDASSREGQPILESKDTCRGLIGVEGNKLLRCFNHGCVLRQK